MSERSSEQYPIIENQVVRVENPQEEEEPEETDNDDESLGNDSRSSRQLLQDGVYEFFSYEHPHDKPGEFYYSAVKNYLHHSKKTAVVFAMGIGHEFFEAMTFFFEACSNPLLFVMISRKPDLQFLAVIYRINNAPNGLENR
jgi:hypothetical protein